MIERYLIYGLVDPRTLMIRYVGKSTSGLARPRVHRSKGRLTSPSHKNSWLRQLFSSGLDYTIAVLEYSDPDLLYDREQWWIAYGLASGWPLTNMTDGGPGATGRVLSDDALDRIRESAKIRMANPDARLLVSSATKARMSDPAARKNLSDKARLRMSTPEARSSARSSAVAQFSSPEARKIVSERNKAAMSTPEARAANSARAKIQMANPEARARLSERTRARFNIPGVREAHGDAVRARATPEARARQGAITTARLASSEARIKLGEQIKIGMKKSGFGETIKGDRNPARRPEVRMKMREASRRRWNRVAEGKAHV